MNDIPRRIQLDKLTPLEDAALELVRACEVAGGHPLLTDAQRKAIEARDILADWIDAGAPGARDDQHWIKRPGPWLPFAYDPDWERPWAGLKLAEGSPAEEAAEAFSSLSIDLNETQHGLLSAMAEAGLFGSSADDVAAYLIIRGLDDLARAGQIRFAGAPPAGPGARA